jgi:hypothetical protein
MTRLLPVDEKKLLREANGKILKSSYLAFLHPHSG